jgi:hypothetical protein
LLNPKSGSNAIKLTHFVFGLTIQLLDGSKVIQILDGSKAIQILDGSKAIQILAVFKNPSFGLLVQITG